jgi:hypothetical protein
MSDKTIHIDSKDFDKLIHDVMVTAVLYGEAVESNIISAEKYLDDAVAALKSEISRMQSENSILSGQCAMHRTEIEVLKQENSRMRACLESLRIKDTIIPGCFESFVYVETIKHNKSIDAALGVTNEH